MQNTSKIILGIDPGTNVMGYGLIEVNQQSMKYLEMSTITMTKLDNHALKLKTIFESCLELIDQYKPDEMALEAPFYGKNVQSMLKLGRAQGVAMAAALYREIPITEYSPRKIKQAISGNGSASKEQVAAMLHNLLSIKDIKKPLDATDALAVAVCHFLNSGKIIAEKKYNSWESYVKNQKK